MRCAPLLVLLLCACGDTQKGRWGLEAIDTMTTPGDGPLTCGVAVPANPIDGCAFGRGARVEETLGLKPEVARQIPIRHVILVMRENRSFDHLFGTFPPGYTNPDRAGVEVAPFHATTTCISPDPGHQSKSMRRGIAGGAMNGWVLNAAETTTDPDGHYVMGHYEAADLPFYFFLKDTFALNERHFAPLVSGTFASRNYLLFGDNATAVDTGIVFPPPETPSLLHLLMNAGFTWAAYSDGAPFSGSLDWKAGDPGVHPLNDLFTALDEGRLPNVAFVDGIEDEDDDHPISDLQLGEAWVKRIYDRAVASPQWPRLAVLFVYDEGGGFPDHVRPVDACRSTPTSPFYERGVRVPFVAISPWAKRGYVSDVVQDHTAITRFIAALFDLPALTARDANSPALLDLFDFTCGRETFRPAAPDGGTGGCTRP